jgi:hypothetical protein
LQALIELNIRVRVEEMKTIVVVYYFFLIPALRILCRSGVIRRLSKEAEIVEDT